MFKNCVDYFNNMVKEKRKNRPKSFKIHIQIDMILM